MTNTADTVGPHTRTLADHELLEAEVLERAVRLYYLVRRAVRHLSVIYHRETAQTGSANQIQGLLTRLIINPLVQDSETGTGEQRLDTLRALLESVALVHEGALPTVPRLIEPIELHSYIRQSAVTLIPKNKMPRVFGSELLGMQVYPNSLVGLIEKISTRQKLMAKAAHDLTAVRSFASAVLSGTDDPYSEQSLSAEEAYVSIPAIDINNPLRWPSLWHEIGHHELIQMNYQLMEKFEHHVGGGTKNSHAFRTLCAQASLLGSEGFEVDRPTSADDSDLVDLGKQVLFSWLRECWCDSFGVQRTGLSFLYSQLHDFMFCFRTYLNQGLRPGQLYPPAAFRLRLARNLVVERLTHRVRGAELEVTEQLIADYKREEAAFQRVAPRTREHHNATNVKGLLASLHTHFSSFLKREIEFNENASLGGDISTSVFEGLEQDLKSGFPIPAIAKSEQYSARSARPAEIILAGWRHRNLQIRSEISGHLTSARERLKGGADFSETVKELVETVGAIADRSDESMKRSLQVAEWFSLLHSSDEVDAEFSPSTAPHIPSLLTDSEISELLDKPRSDSEVLRIIPLISRREQVKGSVIDVRLGHNFEVFKSLVESSIDVCSESADKRIDSFEVEIDRLDGLPILPGQFVLGHTLEYIRLPENVAAQIEGRSSFARLGIQVHMTANLVEAGFDGCLTLEIHNSGPSTVVLYPGMRIAQLRFFRLARNASSTYSRPINKYRGQLSQNKTKQFTDREVAVFRRAKSELERGS